MSDRYEGRSVESLDFIEEMSGKFVAREWNVGSFRSNTAVHWVGPFIRAHRRRNKNT